jgi:hypothetical protein
MILCLEIGGCPELGILQYSEFLNENFREIFAIFARLI